MLALEAESSNVYLSLSVFGHICDVCPIRDICHICDVCHMSDICHICDGQH